jgi:hypothetical protein
MPVSEIRLNLNYRNYKELAFTGSGNGKDFGRTFEGVNLSQ